MMRHRRALGLVAATAAAALVLSACGSSNDAGGGGTTAATTSAAATGGETSAAESSAESSPAESSAEAPGSETSGATGSETTSGAGAAVEGDDDTWCDTIKKDWPNITGKTVSIYTSIVGAELEGLKKSWTDFKDCTGATLNVTGDKNFEQQVVVKAKSGNPSDLAFVPQPGLLATLVATGKVVAAPQQVQDNVTKYWDEGWKKYGTIDGKFYAAPLGANVKSLVWYSPKMFKAKGYTVPTTWDDLIALSDKIAADADGIKPWCAGIESGNATGWPATDWLEEVVLRQAGPDVYDQWIEGKVKFSDPQIADALKTVGSILKNDKYVNAGIGDVSSIATTDFATAGKPIQAGQCYMMQMANFYASNWDKGTDISENGDIFAFYEPEMGTQFGKPVEVGGEFTAAFSDRPEVQAAQFYLSTAHWANNQSKAIPSRISANKGLQIDNVDGAINKLCVTILQDPKSVSRFDASDLMPAAVGAGAEWQQLTAWIASDQDDETTLAQIDAAWPN
ncbi:ABC transporter substrate-binding protein [Nakamurella lactea]|uniref:ABC transporter substrate-binding protein n=1 Tax=Nakamurella lactea TaxID=459515 RepID=UPI0003FE5AD9|nr:ABC transporter substrate-binding protein [Nakamurella lactea]